MAATRHASTAEASPPRTEAKAGARRGRGRPRDPATDGRITQAAAELLLRNGFDKTTVDEVAARAKVGKATVYRRWPSKEDLAVAAMESLYSQEFPEPDTGSIVSDLQENYRSVLTFVNTEDGRAFIRTTIAESIRDERIASLYRASTQHREEQARVGFEKAVARGEVRADADLDTAIQWLGGVIVSRAVVGRAMPSLDELDDLVSFTLHGIATPELLAATYPST